MFITFEGIDGSGKTTIGKYVHDYLKNKGKSVFYTEEPKNILFDVKKIMENDIDDFTRLFIFMADRVEHLKLIREHIEKDEIVICDRFIDSTLAYQGSRLVDKLGSMEKSYEYIMKIFEPFGLEPDMIVYLDVDPELGLKRIGNRKKEFFEMDVEYLTRVRNFYLFLSKKRNYVVIDSNRNLKDVIDDVLNVFQKIIYIL